MRTVALRDVATTGSGGTPKRSEPDYFGDGTPWLSIADLNDGVVTTAKESLTEAGIANSSAKILPAGTLLIAMYGSIGKLGIAGRELCTSQAIAFVRPDPNHVDLRYLFHYFLAERPRLLALGRGGTQMNIGQGDLKEWLIPLPPLDEQRRIAAILDQADALRKKRRQVIVQLDGLAQAIYRDMFRDGEWPQKPIELLGKISTGKTPPTLEPGMFDGPIPFVTPGDLNSRREVARTVSSAGAQASRVVRKGTTLVCCIGATIGKVDQARSACAFNQQINAVEWFDEIDDAYGLESMRELKPAIVAAGASTTMPLLPKSRFGKLSIAVAPVSLQKLFALRTAHLTAQRAVVQHALDLDDQLFSSVQARAFQGEL